jgi:hypothetical protein
MVGAGELASVKVAIWVGSVPNALLGVVYPDEQLAQQDKNSPIMRKTRTIIDAPN